MKALVGAFNQEKALVGASSMIVKSSRNLRQPSFQALQFMSIVCVGLECDHEPFLLSVFLLSAWKKDLVGGAGRRQFIFQPWTP